MSIKLRNSISNSGSLNFAIAPKAISSELKASAKTNKAGNTLTGYFATMDNLAGHRLFTYWLAVMTVLGGFTPNRAPMDKTLIRSFFRSNSVITHHTKNGNLESVNAVSIRLTVTGWNYFQGRLTGATHGQAVDEKELKAAIESIKNGGEGYRAI